MQVTTIGLQEFADTLESLQNLKTESAGPQLIHTGNIGNKVVILMQNGATDTATRIELG
ncbi:hypothetical protein [Methylotuvimicrobium sp. KM1]|uniref:hypothetical protein n=1 Tax=Methylotuvimicrobium sp. KM1 TaxID=3377707 RepID=UPI00385065C1